MDLKTIELIEEENKNLEEQLQSLLKNLGKLKVVLIGFIIITLINLFLAVFNLKNAEAQTLLLEDGFNGSISPNWKQLPISVPSGFPHYAPFTTISPWTVNPTFEGSGAVRYYALQGTNEHTPWQIGFDTKQAFNLDSMSEACVEWREQFDTNYPWPTGSQKVVRWFHQSDLAIDKKHKKELSIFLQGSNTTATVAYFCGLWGDSTNCNVDSKLEKQNVFPIGRLVTSKLYFKLNTPGLSDGILQYYREGNLFLSGSNLNMRGSDPVGYNGFWIGGNMSMVGGIGTLPNSGSRDIDYIRVWDKCPGAVVPTTSTSTTTTTVKTTTTTVKTTTTTISRCQKALGEAVTYCH